MVYAKIEAGDKEARKRWATVLRKRRSTGEPYIMFKGNVNKQTQMHIKRMDLKSI